MSTIESVAQSATRRTGAAIQSNWVWTSVVVGCLLLWRVALISVDVSRMNDYGLISVMNVPCFMALAILTISFCIALRDPNIPTGVLLMHIVALVVMLFGITSVVEQVPRFESTWKHVGVTDYVMRHGSVDSNLDAYFNWPGFFILLAFLTKVTGASSPMAFANWAPPILELMYLPALLVLFRRGTSDRRLVWLSAWCFYLANWIGQDYLSPQGLNYFLYLVILAIVVTWFASASIKPHPLLKLLALSRLPLDWLTKLYIWIAPPDIPSPPTNRFQRIWLLSSIALLYMVITISHQLTPFATVGAIALLVIGGRSKYPVLPVAMAIVAALWLRFGASAYWAGHGSHITEQVGSLDQSVGSNVGDRLSGSPGHHNVVYLRTIMTLAFWLLAGLGCLRRISRGHRDFTFALLAISPFPLIAAQSYGGEILLRVYLFALPFMAFFVAAIFYRSEEVGGSWKTTATIIAVSMIALGSFFVTRYGNERQDYFTQAEVDAANELYETAPPNSVILAGTVKAPWKFRDYEVHKHTTLTDHMDDISPDGGAPDLDAIADILGSSRYNGGYLFITRSEIANDELFGLIPGGLGTLESRIAASPKFLLVYENADAWIFTLNPASSAGQ